MSSSNVIRNFSTAQETRHMLPRVDAIPGIASFRGKLLTTRQEIEEAKEIASQEGFAQGEREGRFHGETTGRAQGIEIGKREAHEALAQAHADTLHDFTEALEGLLDQIQSAMDHWTASAENQVCDLAMSAVHRILSAELELNRDSAIQITREALAEVTHSRKARIRVNPFDSHVLEAHRNELIAAAASVERIEIVTDPSILGGCIIETDGGTIDASLGTRLELLETELEQAS